MRNMPREVLNLGEKRYVESLFTNGKSHLRNDTDHPFQWDMQEGGTLYETR